MIMATIAENLTLLESTKANIKQAIVNKGVSVSDTDTFASYADKIGQISGGSSAAALDFGSINYAYAPTVLKNGLDASVAYLNNWTGNHFKKDDNLMFLPKVEIVDSEPVFLDYVGNTFPKLLIFPDIDFKHKDIKGHQLFEDSKAISIHLKNINFTDSLEALFWRCPNLVDITCSGLTIDSNVTNASNCFRESYYLTAVPDLFNGAQTGLTDLHYMFFQCYGMTTIDLSSWKFGQVTNMKNMFRNCNNTITIDITGIDTSKMTSTSDMSYIFYGCNNLIRIRGAIDLIGMNPTALPSLGYGTNSLTTITYKNLGSNPEATSLNLYSDNYAKWGLGDEESKQSFIDSVLTYSYDRAANGLPTLELKMKPEQKALLTEEQITAIQAKGYTILA